MLDVSLSDDDSSLSAESECAKIDQLYTNQTVATLLDQVQYFELEIKID